MQSSSAVLCAIGLAACGSGGGGPFPDAGPDDDAPASRDAPAADLTAMSGKDAPASGDLAWNPGQPHPPPGSTKCGGGLLTDPDSKLACQAPSFTLDHWGMKMSPFPRACDAASIHDGTWEVWCGSNTAYIFVKLAGLRTTGTLKCKATTALGLSAVYESGNGGGDTGNNMTDGYTGIPGNDFDQQMPIDAFIWKTVDKSAKQATLWLAPFRRVSRKFSVMISNHSMPSAARRAAAPASTGSFPC